MTSRAHSEHIAVGHTHREDFERTCERHQRIAQLVGQHRQKLILAAVDLAQLRQAALQLSLEPLAIGDIAGDPHRSDDAILLVANRRDTDRRVEPGSVLADSNRFVGRNRLRRVDRRVMSASSLRLSGGMSIATDWPIASCAVYP